jgi:2,3-bisphosphoglycerate-dependent phosphoglycerate mutase
MAQLIIIRHGESQWNLENRFTGWVDVDLSPKGIEEAKSAGEKIRPFTFDKCYTSALTRAQRTLALATEIAGCTNLPIEKNQALNERHYGDLQGLNKAETAKKFGDEQVHLWRRSYDTAPPNGESLKDTVARVLPYCEQTIFPDLRNGKNLLVVAHGNSLRALTLMLEKLSPEQIMKVEIPTGQPILYVLDERLEVMEKRIL